MMIFKKSRIRSETSALCSNYVTGPMEIDGPHDSMLSCGFKIEERRSFRTRGNKAPL